MRQQLADIAAGWKKRTDGFFSGSDEPLAALLYYLAQIGLTLRGIGIAAEMETKRHRTEEHIQRQSVVSHLVAHHDQCGIRRNLEAQQS